MVPSHSFMAFADALLVAISAFRTYLRQRLKECGLDLTAEMVQVLQYLWGQDGVNQQEIANAVNRDKATLTSMLDNLEQRGLVERREHDQDRRSKLILLTEKGRALEQQVVPLMQEMYAAASRAVPVQQLQASMGVLEQIAQNLTLARK